MAPMPARATWTGSAQRRPPRRAGRRGRAARRAASGEYEEDKKWTKGEDEDEDEDEDEEGDEGAKAAASEHKSVVMVGVQRRSGVRELALVRAADARG